MSGEKTEKPTDKKVREARKKGQIAKTAELPTGCQLAVIFCYLYFEGGRLLDDIFSLIKVAISVTSLTLEQAIHEFLLAFMALITYNYLILAGLLIVVTIASIMGQVGFVIASESLSPKFDKFNAVNNLKQMFSVKSIVEFLKSIFKMSIIGVVFTYILSHYGNSMQYLPYLSLGDSFKFILQMIYWLWGALIICYLIFSVADYFFQKQQLMKQLMMSKSDIKQEYKDSEGNQEVKGHRRALHQEIQSGSLSASVKKSSLIVRNPTHIAIGIYYDPQVTPLPQITVKGTEARANLIVKMAEDENIPIIEDIPLARAIMAKVDVNQFIPSYLFEPVAELLWLIRELE